VNPTNWSNKLPWQHVLFFQFPNYIISRIALFIPEKIRKILEALPDKGVFWICTKRRLGVWMLYCFDEKRDENFFSMCESALTQYAA
jgi:hypothetical protein